VDEPLIRVRGLTYSYADGTRALDGVDLDLWPQETLILLGPNGSGKTTLLLHLNGLLTGTGLIEVVGVPVTAKNLHMIRSRVGLLFQDPDDQLFMPTVLEDVCFAPLNYGHRKEDAVRIARECLVKVGVEHTANRSPQHLSFGEKRRVAIAGVLAASPDVLALDEPTTYLDPPAQKDLVRLLRALPQAKVIVTHDSLFARAIGSRAVFFERGKIAEEGPVGDVIAARQWMPG
jgi:energy-coupling factor transporter ATP-binding protein EcfA2